MKRNEKPLIVLSDYSASDVSISGGALHLPNGVKIRLQDVIACDIIEPQEEVRQVVDCGSAALNLVSQARYVVRLHIPFKRDQGWPRFTQEFVATAPTDVSDQAVARGILYAALAERINASEFPVTASVVGNSLRITDDAGYWQKGREGASTVTLLPNKDGVGWNDNNKTIVTHAVYSAGIGTDLTKKQPQVDPMIGNAFVGSLSNAQLAKVTGGQLYHTVVFNSIVGTSGNEFNDDQRMRQMYVQTLLIDNGQGADTSQAAAFKQVLREIEKAKYHKYVNDTASLLYFGSEVVTTSGLDQGAPVVTAAALNLVKSPYTQFYSANVGAQGSAANASLKNVDGGVNVAGAATNEIGKEFHLGTATNSPTLTVGKGTFSVRAEVALSDITAGFFAIGFRQTSAAGALSGYENHAAIVTSGADITVSGRLADATAYAFNAETFANDETIAIEVVLRSNGTAEAHIKGKVYKVESADGTDLKIAAGTSVVPFIQYGKTGTDAVVATLEKAFIVTEDESRLKGHLIFA